MAAIRSLTAEGGQCASGAVWDIAPCIARGIPLAKCGQPDSDATSVRPMALASCSTIIWTVTGPSRRPIPLSRDGIPGAEADLPRSTRVCGTARGARTLFSRFHHMRTVRSYVRPVCAVMTAGLDEVREAGGWIKGARFLRLTGFGLSCFGISSRGFIASARRERADGRFYPRCRPWRSCRCVRRPWILQPVRAGRHPRREDVAGLKCRCMGRCSAALTPMSSS
jgi:hypothetical protein